jgi:Uma2 family endonuclease
MPGVLTTLTEYFASSYHPDRDYVDGEVQERSWGEFDHAAVQAFLTGWFFQRRHEWNLHVLPEMRVKVSSERVRIPDVCLLNRDQPTERVLTRPPLAVIEILSPEDRVVRYNERLADYRQMGVGHVWVVDPANRIGYDCSTSAWLPVGGIPGARDFHLAPARRYVERVGNKSLTSSRYQFQIPPEIHRWSLAD